MLLDEVSLETRLQPSRENTNWKPKSISATKMSGGWHSPQTWPIRLMHVGIDSLALHITVIMHCYGIRGVGVCVCVFVYYQTGVMVLGKASKQILCSPPIGYVS